MIFFFYGANRYEARRQIGKLMRDYEQKSGSNFGLERIDGAKVKPDELQGALQASPFLANSRLVIIEDLGVNKTIAPKIGGYITGAPETTIAVFYDPGVDQRTTYFKTLNTKARAVKFEPLSPAKLQSWVARQALEAGAEIERPAMTRLLELAGDDQWRLSNEIAKLAAYRSPITLEAVNQQVEEGNTETIFNLVEAMTAGKINQALEGYHKLRQDGQNEIYMLSMVTWQLRNLLVAKTAGAMSATQLAKAAGMAPFVAGKMLAKRHLFTEDSLKEAFIQAVDTEYRIKSGGGAADVLVEQLIYRIAG
ncbi:MAG TPA: DNA polymerase III subunit delta, partial [Candidatus Polarisedimenticolaceae bacterium]|nr:DNA polymerase III subunit delta [Candidatus Polarisedimenticolaceae bacterium]